MGEVPVATLIYWSSPVLVAFHDFVAALINHQQSDNEVKATYLSVVYA